MDKIQQVIVGDERQLPSSVGNPQPQYNESLQCFQCFITFSEPKAKDRHIRKHHRDQYTQLLQQTNTLFTCYMCDKTFHSSEELSLHQVTHSREETPFLCKECNKSFCMSTELSKHKRFKCKKRPYACKVCGVLFPTSFRLRQHLAGVHHNHSGVTKGINTFRCCKCSCGFETEEELLQHQEMFASDQNCGLKPQVKRCLPKRKCASRKIQEEDEEESSSVELNIPCPKPDCDCTFPSVEALRAHKQEKHGPLKAHS